MPELISLDNNIEPALHRQLIQLQQQCFIPPWSAEQIQQQLNNSKALNFALLADGQLLGFIFYQLLFEQAEILQIAIAPAQRRCGYAIKLISQSIASLLKRDIEQLLLEVRVSNVQAIQLYQQLGFSLDGRRKNYYPSLHSTNQAVNSVPASNREDALLYTLNLDAGRGIQQ
ncbi:MAG: ribosomal protein S18-alanine N-acetyltransferase [Pseudomonadales bacterium]|nr:ribosomal protein S18-alanine N-acetyltransferase [Pseudomonadales bacterium]